MGYGMLFFLIFYSKFSSEHTSLIRRTKDMQTWFLPLVMEISIWLTCTLMTTGSLPWPRYNGLATISARRGPLHLCTAGCQLMLVLVFLLRAGRPWLRPSRRAARAQLHLASLRALGLGTWKSAWRSLASEFPRPLNIHLPALILGC